ncbi:MAG TPA: fumarylacetoacetate hydrolase family protein [Rhizomicrobium sp.]|jgi:2-keto-4-pentenoate hydratase/2-oxohepta-3-ene-1,7-dioic acid hydratase in catechol pathway|nr:fumarylacetoacetate hydrolase family protein [Rhizomicrobium sp.]
MKLATFVASGTRRVGLLAEDGLIDLSIARPGLPRDMIGLIAAWPEAEPQLRAIAGDAPHLPLRQARLVAPIPRPGKILAIGLNYADHIAESGQARPERQIWFSKAPSAVNGPFDPIVIPRVSDEVDYEAELVAVIGRRCRHVSRSDAPRAIFGFAAGNDVSVRDWQFSTSQWILGKSFDTHAPFGPWIVTADEIGDPHTLGLRAFVNGEIRQNSNTKNMVFDVFDQVAHLSQVMTLEPGDTIFTGTPGGVGMAFRPPRYLKAGDRVRVEIDRIGALEAQIMAESADPG